MPRTVGLALGALCAGAGMLQANAPGWAWSVMLGYCAFWPHLAFQISCHAAVPRLAERRNLLLDSLAGGFWVVAMGFNLLPSVLLLTALAMNNLAAGGGRLFGHGLVAHVLGAGAGLLLLGLNVQVETSFTTLLWCLPFLMTYPLVLGMVTYRLAVELARGKDEIVKEKQRADEANLAKARALADLASRDELTGLYNRRHVLELLTQLRLACQRSGTGFAVALLDLDHFKRINDTCGHAGGDHVLRVFAGLASRQMRGSDVVGRWGGEEFIAVFHGATAHEAAHGAERLRELVAAAEAPMPGGEHLRFTVSIGLTHHLPPESVDATIERADRAMYQAKSQGRNRVVTMV